jgi:hypothetical protein
MVGWIFLIVVCMLILKGLVAEPPKSTPPYTPPKANVFKPVIPTDHVTDPVPFVSPIIQDQMAKAINKAAKVKNPLDWFVVEKAQDQISVAEGMIIKELNKYKIDWYREIAFNGLKFSDYGYARYDFLIITHKGIHLIEYDGKASHCTDLQIERDTIKNKFCSTNNIPLTRYNNKHYYHLPLEISRLMTKYDIKRKP